MALPLRFTALRVRRAHRGYLCSQQCKQEQVWIAWPEGDIEPSKHFFVTAAGAVTLERLGFMTAMGRGSSATIGTEARIWTEDDEGRGSQGL